MATVMLDEKYAVYAEAIRDLAAFDSDYASKANDVGFSRFDAAVGHALASMPFAEWTPAQLAQARRILQRYRNTQLPGLGYMWDDMPDVDDQMPVRDAGTRSPGYANISLEGGVFLLQWGGADPYFKERVEDARSMPGSKYDKDLKAWRVPVSLTTIDAIAQLMAKYAGTDLPFSESQTFRGGVEAYIAEVESKLHASAADNVSREALKLHRAKDADKVRPFQLAGIKFAVENKQTIIADDMGLGKTVQSILSVAEADAFPALVICPASLKLNWKREIEMWVKSPEIEVLDGTKPSPQVIDRLIGLGAFDTKIGANRDEQREYIYGVLDMPIPARLGGGASIDGAESLPLMNPATDGGEPFDQADVSVRNADMPEAVTSRDNGAFAIDDPRQIGEIGVESGDVKTDGPLVPPDALSSPPLEVPVKSHGGNAKFGSNVSDELPRLGASHGGQDDVFGQLGELSAHDQSPLFIVINYDILAGWLPVLRSLYIQSVIMDEAHYLKSESSRRTKAAVELLKATAPEYRYVLSGTPILNKPIEMWPVLGMIDGQKQFGGWFKFAMRYCGLAHNGFGYSATGATNLDELNTHLRSSGLMVRRRKEDVLKELPDKQWAKVPVPFYPATLAKAYDNAERDLEKFLREMSDADDNEQMVRAAALQRIATLRQIAWRGKEKAIREWIDGFLETGKKLIVFGWHREAVEAIANHYNAPSIMGGMNKQEVEDGKERFQNDPDCRVIVCNIAAGGVGHTLTAASDVLFIEYAWNYALMDQAISRAHRIGQKDTVTGWMLAATLPDGRETIDHEMIEVIEAKESIVKQAIDGNVEKSAETMRARLRSLLQDAEADNAIGQD